MQTGRSYSPDELIAMNSAAEAAKQEMLSTVVEENVRVYRNVQAAVRSDLDSQTSLLKQEISLLKEELQKAQEENRKLLSERKLHSPLLVWTFLFAFSILCIEVMDFTGVLDYLIRIGNAFFFGA